MVVGQACPSSAWCGFKRDNSGNGRALVTALFSGVSSLTPLWQTGLSAATGIYSGPSVIDVTGDGIPDIVVGDDDGTLRCFNGPDGTVLWSISVSNSIYSTPAVGDLDGNPATMEVVFTYGSNVRAVRGADGSTLWTSSCSGYTYNGSPRIVDLNGDGLQDVVVSTSSYVCAFNGSDGSLLWSTGSGRGRSTVPAVGDLNHDGFPDVVAYSDQTNDVVALSGPTGSVIWSYHLSGYYPSSPVVEDLDGDGHYDVVVSNEERMARLGEDGSLIWSRNISMDFSSDAHESPVVGWDIDGDGVKDIFQSAYSGSSTKLKAISGSDGSQIWANSSLVETHGSAPITVGEFETSNPGYEILYNDHSGRLNVIDARSGTLLWYHTYGSGPFGSGYSVLADVNGDTCIDFVLRGEADSPKLAVYTSSIYGTCRTSYDDPTAVSEAVRNGVEFNLKGRVLNLKGRGRFSVLTADGRIVAGGQIDGYRNVPLKPGTYILKYGGKTAKVVVR